MIWLVLTILIVLAVWLLLRVRRSEGRVRDLEGKLDRRIAELTRRVYSLEQAGAVAAPEPEPALTAPPVEAEPPLALEPNLPGESPVVEAPSPPSQQPRQEHLLPAETRQPRRDWEAILGTNLLNKIGVLAIVIGIALFVGYAFTLMGPGGRIALSAALSAAMLLGGVAVERRERYRAFARGLIGGGWAGLYVSAYAAHGIEGAQVIESPVWGTVLLVGVSVVMLLHSLRYRSQVVTGVAYFVVFISLAITPLTFFALVASVPLAVSLLYLSHRFSWRTMALPGLVGTYGLYALQAARLTEGSLGSGQAVLLVYWLLFETFDLLDARRQSDSRGLTSILFPANAVCWIALSWNLWDLLRPEAVYRFFLIAALLYLASAAVRMWPDRAASEKPFLNRLAAGGQEGPLTLAIACAAAGLIARLDGVALTVALFLEAEVVYISGVWRRWRFLRVLAGILFAATVGRVALALVVETSWFEFWGTQWQVWTGPALLGAALLYLNRAVGWERWQAWAGSALLALVILVETGRDQTGLGWLALAVALAAAALWTRAVDIYRNSYLAGGLGALALVFINGLGVDRSGEARWWLQITAAAVLFALSAADSLWRRFDLGERERKVARRVYAGSGTVLLLAFLHTVFPPELVTLAWMAPVMAYLGLAIVRRDAGVRFLSYGAATLAFGQALLYNLVEFGDGFDTVLGVPVIGTAICLFLAQAMAEKEAAGNRLASVFFSTLGSVLTASLLYNSVSGSVLTLAWGTQAILTLATGFLFRNQALRLTGLVFLIGCTGKLFFYDLRNLETLPRILSFVVLGAILVGASWVYTRYRERIGRLL